MTMKIMTTAILTVIATASLWSAETRVGIVLPEYCKNREESAPAEHTTACALEPDCVASGFGLLIEDRFIRFDARGDELALKYFETTERVDGHIVESSR